MVIRQKGISSGPVYVNPGETLPLTSINVSSENGDVLVSSMTIEVYGTTNQDDGILRLYSDDDGDSAIGTSDSLLSSCLSSQGERDFVISGSLTVGAQERTLLVGFEAYSTAQAGHGVMVSIKDVSTSSGAATILREGGDVILITSPPSGYGIDGVLDDWGTLQPDSASDSDGLEIVGSGIAIDGGMLYACLQTGENMFSTTSIPLSTSLETGTMITLYIDRDGAASGYAAGSAAVSADYKIELWGLDGMVKTSGIYRYTGTTATQNTWKPLGVPELAFHEDGLEIGVPLGILNMAQGDGGDFLWECRGMGGGDLTSVVLL